MWSVAVCLGVVSLQEARAATKSLRREYYTKVYGVCTGNSENQNVVNSSPQLLHALLTPVLTWAVDWMSANHDIV